MITTLELKTRIEECEQNMYECHRAVEAAKSLNNTNYARSQLREGKSWKSKRAYYLRCMEAINSMTPENMANQRNLLLAKIATIEDRCYNDLWSMQPIDANGRKPRPEMSIPAVREKYNELCERYDLSELKRHLKTLNFILQ